MLKDWLLPLLVQALTEWRAQTPVVAALPEVDWSAMLVGGLRFERPKRPEFGEIAVNVSFLARVAKLPPPVIAQQVAGLLPLDTDRDGWCEAAAGFVNVHLSDTRLSALLLELARTPGDPGSNQTLAQERVLLEFVSANPTGPLHIGHGRWAALGDSIARLMRHCGAQVTTEFYVNNYGRQMANLSASFWYRCLEQLGQGGLPAPVEGEKYAFYPGQYLADLAARYLQDPLSGEARKADIQARFAETGPEPPAYKTPLELALRGHVEQAMLADQRRLLDTLHVPFDRWTMETDLHEGGAVAATIDRLKASGHTFELDGALWLNTTQYGDDKDRVLVKQDDTLTYLTADIAYHDQKLTRPDHYTCALNIWGADHHGYIPRMKASLQALGHDPERLEILLGQLVTLKINGETTRMGKRRTMVTLADLAEDVGVDGVRFWMVSRSSDTTLEFDVDLAASASQDNPVFYVQYAHARACSLMRHAVEPQLNTQTGETLPALMTPEAFATWVSTEATPEALSSALFSPLADKPQARQALVELLLQLQGVEALVIDAAKNRMPHLLVRYLMDLAAGFHAFYNHCRIVDPAAPDITRARLALMDQVRRVLATGLGLLGVSAPEAM
jgi:arginyl-tRNA synthetase